jgi:hypothetical protein
MYIVADFGEIKLFPNVGITGRECNPAKGSRKKQKGRFRVVGYSDAKPIRRARTS